MYSEMYTINCTLSALIVPKLDLSLNHHKYFYECRKINKFGCNFINFSLTN